MIAEVTAALSTLKTAKDFTKAVIDSKTSAALREQAIEFQFSIIEIQNALMAMQSQYQILLQEKDAIKKQLIEMEQWNAESAKYDLTEVSGGVFAYVLRVDESSTTPKHWLCAKCYEDKQKSIIQMGGYTPLGWIYTCARCKTSIYIAHTKPTKPQVRFRG